MARFAVLITKKMKFSLDGFKFLKTPNFDRRIKHLRHLLTTNPMIDGFKSCRLKGAISLKSLIFKCSSPAAIALHHPRHCRTGPLTML